MKEQTIDKVPFRITLPYLGVIILATASILAAYYNLQMGITQANVSIAQVYKEVQTGNTQHEEFKSELADHEKRITIQEAQRKQTGQVKGAYTSIYGD